GAEQDALMPSLVHKDRLAEKPLIDAIRRMGVDTAVTAFKRQQAAIMTRPDSRRFLASIRCPPLVLVGREDALTPVDLAQEIAARIPGAWLEIVPACGHLSTMERPEAVNR